MAYEIYRWDQFKNKHSEIAQMFESAYEAKVGSKLGDYEEVLFCFYGTGECAVHTDERYQVELHYATSVRKIYADQIVVGVQKQDFSSNPFEDFRDTNFEDLDIQYRKTEYNLAYDLSLGKTTVASYLWNSRGGVATLYVVLSACGLNGAKLTKVMLAVRDTYNSEGTSTNEFIEAYYYPSKLPTPTLSISCDDAVLAAITETESATTFHLEYRRSGTSTWSEYTGHILSEDSNTETVDLTDLLTGGTVYEFRAYCSDSSGEYENSAYSDIVSFKLFSKVAYKSVKSRTTSAISFYTTNLGLTSGTTWIAQYKKRGTDTWLTATTSNTSSQLTVSSKTTLTADSVYDFRIRLTRSEGESTWFYVAQTTRSNQTAPAPACTAGSTTIAATWTPPTGYNWYRLSATLNGTVVAQNDWTQETSGTLTGLTPGTTYVARVQYRITADGDAYENDGYRGTTNVTTLQQLAAPTGLIATNITSNSARLAWNAVNNANDYQVEFRPQGTSNWTTQQ